MAKSWALALHGGAGPLRKRDHAVAETHMAELLREGEKRLARGDKALDVVHALVIALEECGHHIAGRGSSPNAIGQWELDAAIMDGRTRNAGAVASLRGYKSPVTAARLVMEKTPHVLIVGKGAAMIAREHKLEKVHSPKSYYRPAVTRPVKKGELAHGTVGAVALDTDGRLASATSTGGLLGKTPGRVGDTPIIGAGLWADERVAVCCTGQGEYFLRTNAAADVSSRVRYGKQGLREAAEGSLEDLTLLGGDGGMICLDVLGHVEVVFNAETMKRGVVTSAGRFDVATMR
ncbi:isoaspartyl peptidase/L-asparaginase family protein [Henriciella marina]|uniref:Isoaspartyl peptidase/L-asparaginase n=1 Tax=Henriciella marina TaxID=453851 RepID=A0ABT4LRH9_9PROT|nr:isoaspartyl peptidase/L-asparaginase [Henriciella marina]MCZ4296964.1 isoaspartyl peptidase/L-asparaginase [Henriciella marina]